MAIKAGKDAACDLDLENGGKSKAGARQVPRTTSTRSQAGNLSRLVPAMTKGLTAFPHLL